MPNTKGAKKAKDANPNQAWHPYITTIFMGFTFKDAKDAKNRARTYFFQKDKAMKFNNRIANHFPQSQSPSMNKPPIILHAAKAEVVQAHVHEMPPAIAEGLCVLPCSCCRENLAAFEPTFLELRDKAIQHNRKLVVICPDCTAEVNAHIAAQRN